MKKIERQLDECIKWFREVDGLIVLLPQSDQDVAAGSVIVQRIQEKSSTLTAMLNTLNPVLTDQ